ncbi:hypothetical protein ACQ4PT_049558 [Festuca glaucescens]
MAKATAEACPRLLLQLLLLLLCFASPELVVHGQPDSLGFISIDCGIADGTSYSDESVRGLRYVSDVGFVDASAGVNGRIAPSYSDRELAMRYLNVRYFPGARARNCYTLAGLSLEGRYLVRGTFYYGNYDSLNRLPTFDLHLGVNRWATVNFNAADDTVILEAVVVSPADFLQVCLVDIGQGTPFISGLDLRPLKAGMYPEATVSQSLFLLSHHRLGARFRPNRYHFWRPASTYRVFRYPFDPYDRIWQTYGDVASWTNITTTARVNISDSGFNAPSVVLQSAATPLNGTQLDFSWSPDPSINNDDSSTAYLLLLYFAELQQLPSNALRQFDILVASWSGSQSYSPKYLFPEVVERMVIQGSGQITVSLVATPDATLPPTVNAFEVYSVRQMTELATDNEDAKAMMAIRTTYRLKKNWMGDPCAPKAFAWDGLNCSYSSSGPASITSINLSSSLLTGAVDPSFGDLKSLQYLDFSNNSLSGSIPDFLAQMPALTFLICNNTNIYDNGASTCAQDYKGKNRTLVIAVAVSIAVATLLFVAAILVFHRRRNKQDTWMTNNAWLNSPRERSNISENRRFSYKELKLITANFREEIGRGGFGVVFLGYLANESPVAVKIRSKTSSQGDKEFQSEAQHLSRVHHRNLVSMIGYCKDKKHLALVYEYMHGGDLEDRLRGEASVATPLSWHRRLKIALDSAQGLEYLHKSCQPPLIHRDPAVSTSDTESIHIAQWVRQKLSEGNIESIPDSKIGREYDVNSLCKVTELALQCKEQPSRDRPTMTDVVAELKECLELEVSRGIGSYSSVTSSTNNFSATNADLHSDAQASTLMQPSMLELGQVVDASPTHTGPAQR